MCFKALAERCVFPCPARTALMAYPAPKVAAGRQETGAQTPSKASLIVEVADRTVLQEGKVVRAESAARVAREVMGVS
ncbi:MAG: hypothetical protein M3Y27_32135 [Acidobacteriota bacterium]|nr:hypothetical protein [Acidobacteriota bacterium]